MSPRPAPRVVYLCGVLAFVGSWLAPATANRMTDAEGTAVAEWVHPIHTQLSIALEPAVRLGTYLSAVPEADARGDGFEAGQAWSLWRAFVSTPAAVGWVTLVAIIAGTPWWMGRRSAFVLRVAGGGLVAAGLWLARDFALAASVYPGHFHLGLGGYLLVAAYLLVGAAHAWGVMPG